MERYACCFSGHRGIPPDVCGKIELLLDRHIEDLAACGVDAFICGGALGFDTMAALAVMRARMKFPAITLGLAVPYRGVEKRWPEGDRELYETILRKANSTAYIAEEYDRGCMLRRDRYMVDRSRICLCYMTRDTGGTAYTVGYALQCGIEVINLAVEL